MDILSDQVQRHVLDKGYNSEEIHRLIREDFHANSVIPIRSWNNEIIGSTFRQEMVRRFNDIIYSRWQLVENKYSFLKRKFNGNLKSRRFPTHMKEIANEIIVSKLHRFLQFLIIEVFYRAHFCIIFNILNYHYHRMAWIKCDSGRSFVQAEQITKIWGNCQENPVIGFTVVKSTITITALDSGNEESIIYRIEIDYDPFDDKKDPSINCEEAKKNWETEVVHQTDTYMKEILIEITKQIDAAIESKDHQILDFSKINVMEPKLPKNLL